MTEYTLGGGQSLICCFFPLQRVHKALDLNCCIASFIWGVSNVVAYYGKLLDYRLN